MVLTPALRKVSFWIGVACAVAMPLVPLVYRWLHPPAAPAVEPASTSLLSLALGILGSLGEGIMVMVWMSGFALAAVLASVVACALARRAGEPRRTVFLSLMPALLVITLYGMLVLMGA